jgi:hypothetical protein
MSAVLTEDEKNRIRHHGGYLLTNPVSSIQLGFPRASQPQFLVESAMNNLPEAAVGQIRRYISILDTIEDQLVDATLRFKAKKLAEIELRDNETDMLEREYSRWAKRLYDDLGCPLNIYSERFRAGGGASINVPVLS